MRGRNDGQFYAARIHNRPSARDTLYGRETCTTPAAPTAEVNSACLRPPSELLTSPGAPELRETIVCRKRRFLRAVRDGCPLPTKARPGVETRLSAAGNGPPKLRESAARNKRRHARALSDGSFYQRRLPRASGLRSPLTIRKSFHQHRCFAARNIGRPPWASATFSAARVSQPPVCPGHALRTQDLHDARCTHGGSEFRRLAAAL